MILVRTSYSGMNHSYLDLFFNILLDANLRFSRDYGFSIYRIIPNTRAYAAAVGGCASIFRIKCTKKSELKIYCPEVRDKSLLPTTTALVRPRNFLGPTKAQHPFSERRPPCLWRLSRRDCQCCATCWNIDIFSPWSKAGRKALQSAVQG